MIDPVVNGKREVEIITAEPLEPQVTIADLDRKVTDILRRMEKVEQLASMCADAVVPVLDELRNGPIGRMLGLKQDRK